MDPTADIVHMGDKYAHIRTGDTWLRERLSTTITRRRQYLYYRREHQKVIQEVHEVRIVDGKTVWSGEKASTYLRDESLASRQEGAIIISRETPRMARTEYADSSRGKDGAVDLLRTPLLPKDADGVRAAYGQHFECHLCWRPQIVQNKNEWKRVVLS